MLNLWIPQIIGGFIGGGFFAKYWGYWFEKRRVQRQVERELNKYKNPVLYAAFKLHKRLDTVFDRLTADNESKYWLFEKIPIETAKRPPEKRKRLENYFKKSFDERYFVIATIYSIAELIAWIEIFHKTALRLEFIGSKAIRKFMEYLELIRIGFCERKILKDLPYEQERQRQRIFEYFFQSIGETLITREPSGSLDVKGFSEFLSKYKYGSNEFRKQFRSIRNLLVDLEHGNKNDFRWDRLVAIDYFVKLFLDKNTPKKGIFFIRRRLFRQIRNRKKISENAPGTPITELFYPEHQKTIFENIKSFEKQALFQ